MKKSIEIDLDYNKLVWSIKFSDGSICLINGKSVTEAIERLLKVKFEPKLNHDSGLILSVRMIKNDL